MAIKLVPQREENRFAQLAQLQLSFPQPTKDSVGVLAELRCAEAAIDDDPRGFAYTIALRAGVLQLQLEGCRIKPGPRPDDLIGVRSKARKIKVSDKTTARLNAGLKGGVSASLQKLGLGARTTGSAGAAYARIHSRQSTYTLTQEERFVIALPGNSWRIRPDHGRFLDRTYLADSIICHIETLGDEVSIQADFIALPRDIEVVSIYDGLLLHVLKHFPYNKMRIAALLVAKGLAAAGARTKKLGLGSAVTFCTVRYISSDSAGAATPPVLPSSLRQVDAIRALLESHEKSFSKLVRLAGLRPKSDFRNSNLSGIDFGQSDLTGFDFSGADLRCADFRRAKVADADFTGADLSAALWPGKEAPQEQPISWTRGAPDPNIYGLEAYKAIIAKYPALAPEQEYMLAKRFQEHLDGDAASALYTSSLRTAAAISRRWFLDGLSCPGILAAANAGLAEAIVDFEADEGMRLASAASSRIRRRLADHILERMPLVVDAVGMDAAKVIRRKLMQMRRRSEQGR